MENFAGVHIVMLGYPLSVGLMLIATIGLKKVKNESNQLNYDMSDEERKKRFLYLVFIILGYIISAITTIILLLILFDINIYS
ncbi:MAG: hypothetical protein RBR71_10035 [Gudongella sp.]|nr:hypothetical protein [Gudongella sp.]